VRSLLTVHDMAAHAVQRFGTKEAKERFLPAMVRGESAGVGIERPSTPVASERSHPFGVHTLGYSPQVNAQ